MNQKSLTKLEFPKIIEMLTDHASSPGGASFCRRIKPMTDLNKIITAQEQTAAAFTRIVKKGIPSFSGCYAVSDSLKRLEIGSALSHRNSSGSASFFRQPPGSNPTAVMKMQTIRQIVWMYILNSLRRLHHFLPKLTAVFLVKMRSAMMPAAN